MKKRSTVLDAGLPGWLNAALVAGTAAALLYFETRRPLRRTRQEKVRRNLRNLAMSGTTAAAVGAVEKPVALYLMKASKRLRFGLLRWIRMPAWLELLVSVLLLDYTLYIWHVLTHRVPALWRLHQVHHADLDLDASTALRFHPGEMVLSAPWRGAQVLLLGVSPPGLSLWQTLTLLEILFHHSNVRLPIEFERRLSRVIVTPRMHGIHHSIVHEETDSNWATIFSWPDYLHRTARLNVPQGEITIGVPAFQDPEELTLKGVLELPVAGSRPSWRFADGGSPERDRTGSRTRLLA
ncbi:MAG TPA: sterol desaturase family protein [Candidatus Aquicultoraceae bacterium]|nr:sterol desaturase family protein [Candidatus Aquicultoraceae bacterium]